MSGDDIRITVDGLEHRVPGQVTVQEVLELLGEQIGHALIELNGRYLPPARYPTTRLSTGDRLEVIYPAFGG